MLEVDGRSKVLALFGCPVEHSLSPAMQNAALAALRLHYIYVPFLVAPDDLGAAVQAVRALGIIGVNLTIPHKERAAAFLDEVDPHARLVGAVNTVHNVRGRLVGYNTDGEGFRRPLELVGWRADGRRAVVLGAGGAARSVVFGLAAHGVPVVVVNRTGERAARLAEEAGTAVRGADVRWLGLNDRGAVSRAVAEASLLVNATPVGMQHGAADEVVVPAQALHADLTVYDLVYTPPQTALLQAARAAGARTLNGVAMLAYQGAAALRIWTGAEPPVALMEQVVLQCLQNRNAT